MNFKPPVGTKLNEGHGLAKAIVGCWLLNEGAGIYNYDSSEYKKTLTMIGMSHPATATSGWGVGKFGVTPLCDGSNDYVGGTSVSLANSPYTLSLWVKPTAWIANRSCISLGATPGNDTALTVRQTSNTGLLFSMYNDDLSVTGLPTMANVWSHIVCTLDALKAQILYFNGVAFGSRTATAMYSGTADMSIGRRGYGGDEHWSGALDAVYMYKRALLPQEVMRLYTTPFAMFERPKRVYYSVPTVAASSLVPILQRHYRQRWS